MFYKKGVLENFAKFTGKHLWFAKFSRTPFLQNTSATATLLGWGTASSVWKNSDEYSLSRNTNLRSIVRVYHFFLGSIHFQCMFSLVYAVYFQKQPPEQECSVKKGFLKNFVNFIGKHLCWSLFLIKLQAWHLVWRTSAKDWFYTTHCYLSVLLYIQHFLPHHHCYSSEAVVRRCSIKKRCS